MPYGSNRCVGGRTGEGVETLLVGRGRAQAGLREHGDRAVFEPVDAERDIETLAELPAKDVAERRRVDRGVERDRGRDEGGAESFVAEIDGAGRLERPR